MRTIQDMVRQEVLHCVSSLVERLREGRGAIGPVTERSRDLHELCALAQDISMPMPDYQEAATQRGWPKAGDDSTAEEFCRNNSIPPYGWEVYEHWLVSTWLAEQLARRDQRVTTDFADLPIWGRTNTGQSIEADSVIMEIYAATHQPEGA